MKYLTETKKLSICQLSGLSCVEAEWTDVEWRLSVDFGVWCGGWVDWGMWRLSELGCAVWVQLSRRLWLDWFHFVRFDYYYYYYYVTQRTQTHTHIHTHTNTRTHARTHILDHLCRVWPLKKYKWLKLPLVLTVVNTKRWILTSLTTVTGRLFTILRQTILRLARRYIVTPRPTSLMGSKSRDVNRT